MPGASSRHLTRLFEEYAGMSVTEYRNNLRVALARQLLSQTEIDMDEVAEKAGFGRPDKCGEYTRGLRGRRGCSVEDSGIGNEPTDS